MALSYHAEIVSIHALARRATCSLSTHHHTGVVSIHALARRATPHGAAPAVGVRSFNPRPRTEGDPEAQLNCRNGFWFQSTPSHGGRLAQAAGLDGVDWFQSTPSHGGRPKLAACRLFRRTVSIHALARRATSIPGDAGLHGPVSIHALARRATPELGQDLHGRAVSIHALARRATFKAPDASTPDLFQSTPSHGGRQNQGFSFPPGLWFQSTPSHGGRQGMAV